MKTILMSSAVVLSMASLAAAAEEMSSSFSWGDVTFQPRAYAGYADYELKSGDMTRIQDNNPPVTAPLQFALFNRSKLDIRGPIFGLGGTATIGRFFGDIYYQAIPSEVAYSSEDIPRASVATTHLDNVNVEHRDWALSLGYRITDQWSIFAGYKSGNTSSSQNFQTNLLPPLSGLVQAGNFDINFDQNGPFLGTSYSFFIGPGALTVKAAYAYLNGTYKSDFNSVCYPPLPQCPTTPVSALQQFNWEGDSNAFSFGLSWTQSLMDNLGLSLGANYHKYKFNASGSKSFTNMVGGEVVSSGLLEGGNLTESLFTLTASLLYTF